MRLGNQQTKAWVFFPGRDLCLSRFGSVRFGARPTTNTDPFQPTNLRESQRWVGIPTLLMGKSVGALERSFPTEIIDRCVKIHHRELFGSISPVVLAHNPRRLVVKN